jgi:hypothetical protein
VINNKEHNEKIRGLYSAPSVSRFYEMCSKTHKGLLFVQSYSWNIEMTRKGKGKVHPTMSHEGAEGGAEVQL